MPLFLMERKFAEPAVFFVKFFEGARSNYSFTGRIA